jgi:hypothetical protein
MTDKEKPKAAHKIRAGTLELAIWRNDGEKGPWYSVSATMHYKQGEEWKQSDSFGQDDLLVLAKLLGSRFRGHHQVPGTPYRTLLWTFSPLVRLHDSAQRVGAVKQHVRVLRHFAWD